ncbi:MAG TPA: S8 family serine peptidase [Acidimicrobiales bacterium]|nr:S8 family serine peptidase [Acidimicrobiales bacterium]
MSHWRTSASSGWGRRPRRRQVLVTSALAISLLGIAGAAPPAGAQEEPGAGFSPVAELTPSDRVEGAKSDSGRLAETDPALLGLDSPDPVPVVVKLDYDALAAYKGDIAGLPATSPEVTGEALDLDAPAARSYEGYIEQVETEFLDALASEVPAAATGDPLRVVYGGVPAEVPGDQIETLLSLPGVAAVQPDTPEQPDTDASPAFIGAPTLYDQLGATPANAGAGVIVGVLDSGAWPEHPSLADTGTLPAPPPTPGGTPRVCDFGDNPLTPAPDVFACNDKLIGGQPFLDTYNAVFGGEVYPDSARDSNGHGTHTATTAAGSEAAASIFGIDRGAIHGIAPGAHVMAYKVCGLEGCFPSDSVRAVAQAIVDGVDVINFSISGGNSPFGDPVELAFLDAYAAGVFVSASAGNEGPGPDTVNHRSPWVTTVAASTQQRAFQSTVTLTGAAGATATVAGASITPGIASPLPVVSAADPPYADPLCLAPAPAGLFTGKIVVCQRGPGRAVKGLNVLAGGAAGMLLVNPTPADTLTDNHFLPTVHLDAPEGATLAAFLAANPGTTAGFTAGAPVAGQGDVIANFSSRGPGGDWLKPDVAAPGVQILAGNTPTPDSPAGGPPGELYQAIAGTSMAAPHVAGAGALVAALHPDWTPGQIKSALTTTATTAVVKDDKVTPADPFDMGGGRIALDRAGTPGLTFDATAADLAATAADPLHRIDANTPTVNATTMPGTITTTRVATNVTSRTLGYRVGTTAPPGATISVSPRNFSVAPGASVTLTITISGPGLADGQYFGEIVLDRRASAVDAHLPVAFFRTEGAVTLDQTCTPTTITRPDGTSDCTVTVANGTTQDTTMTAHTVIGRGLRFVSVTGATQVDPRNLEVTADLPGGEESTPSVAPGTSPGGFIPLDLFGVAPIPVGDEEILNFNVPDFVYDDATWSRIGVDSNGYIVVGGGVAGDNDFLPQTFPDPARPNNVLAPFWTDLDGTGAPGILATTLTDGVNSWLVVEWQVNVFGTTSNRHFQVWIGIDGTQDVTYAYDPAALPADPNGQPFNVGAENATGSGGDNEPGLPTTDLRVTSTENQPGGTATWSFTLRGTIPGERPVTTSMTTPLVLGTTEEVDLITVH